MRIINMLVLALVFVACGPEERFPATDGGTADCKEGEVRWYFDGDEAQASVGQCSWGVKQCRGGELIIKELAVLPSNEVCNGKDDDCDGTIDNGVCGNQPIDTAPVFKLEGALETPTSKDVTSFWGSVKDATGIESLSCQNLRSTTTEPLNCIINPPNPGGAKDLFWSVEGSLREGDNPIVLTARDIDGNVGTKVVQMFRSTSSQQGTNPVIEVAQLPVVYQSTFSFGGTASDSDGVVQVSCQPRGSGNHRCTNTRMFGSGINVSWLTDTADLQIGSNEFEITARDGLGATTSRTVVVNRGSGSSTTAPTVFGNSSFTTTSTPFTFDLFGQGVTTSSCRSLTYSNQSCQATVHSQVGESAVRISVTTSDLQTGTNRFEITGHGSGLSDTHTVDVVYNGSNTGAVTVSISDQNGQLTATGQTIIIGGVAQSTSGGQVNNVFWYNQTNGQSGTVQPFVPSSVVSWTASVSQLTQGVENNIRVIAYDTNGKVGEDTTKVVFSTSATGKPVVTTPFNASTTSSSPLNLNVRAEADAGKTITGFECKNDTTGVPCLISFQSGQDVLGSTQIPLQNGVNRLMVRAKDNTDTWSDWLVREVTFNGTIGSTGKYTFEYDSSGQQNGLVRLFGNGVTSTCLNPDSQNGYDINCVEQQKIELTPQQVCGFAPLHPQVNGQLVFIGHSGSNWSANAVKVTFPNGAVHRFSPKQGSGNNAAPSKDDLNCSQFLPGS